MQGQDQQDIYRDGRNAHAKGDSLDECPHKSQTPFNNARWAWMSGWLHASLIAKFPRLFKPQELFLGAK